MKSKTLQNIKSILFALAIVLGTSYVSAAWTAPTLPPPGGNVSAPLNVGGNDVGVASYPQIKSGILTLMRLITPDLTVTKSDGTVTGIPAGSVLTAIGENTGKVGWGGGATGTGGGDTLVGVKTAYTSAGAGTATIPVVTGGADYATITMYGNGNSASAPASDEDHDFMEVYLDLTNSRSTGIHGFTMGQGDSWTTNYTWNDQAFGTPVTVAAGNTSFATSKVGVVMQPSFRINAAKTQITVSNITSRWGWQATWLAKFYR